MDDLKHRAGEKLEALHVAAVTAAGNGKTKVQDAYNNTSEGIQKIKDIFHELWHNELIAEGRARVAAWTRETAQRIRDGAPPLSPMQLYEELRTMFNDRVWRRSVLIFACGVIVGGGCGLALGLRAAGAEGGGRGPHARALHTQPDQSVILVDDAVTAGAGMGEVLVRVQAFSACPCDRRVLRGRGQTLRSLLHHHNLTLGRGFAGIVLDVGHGVGHLELGDEVWGCVSEWSGGAATELLTIRSTRVSKRPMSVSADGAAALAWSGAAALHALHALRYTPDNTKGKRVAICGAASGEGCVLVQLLCGWGAHLTVCAPRHAATTLQQLGAKQYVDIEKTKDNVPSEWAALETNAKQHGPWDCLVTCETANVPAGARCNTSALLKSTVPRRSALDLRPHALLSDRLPAPCALVYAASFYTYRILRWLVGYGSHTDWLEDKYKMREGLEILAQLVETRHLTPMVDKIYLPQEFENALAHACSEDAIGTTVWLVGYGSHTDWLEDKYKMREGLEILAQLVETRHLTPMVDKIYLPQEFENALAHACSEDAIGTTVWLVGYGSHTDWLEDKYKMREGLEILAQLVETRHLTPMVDKIYLPQEFENALAHACSEDAIGTTVVRFP